MSWWQGLRQWVAQRGRRDVQERLDPLDMLIKQAAQAQFYNEYEAAYAALDKAAEQAVKTHNINKQVEIDLSRGDILIAQGQLDEAEKWLDNLREECAGREHMTPVAYALTSLGVVAQKRDDWESAQQYFEQAREVAEKLPSDGAKGRSAAHLAEVYMREENAHFATYLLEKALPLLETSGDHDLLAYFWGRLGAAHFESQRWQDAIEATERGLDVAKMMDQPQDLFVLYTQLAQYLLERKKPEQAQSALNAARPYVDFGDAAHLQTIEDKLKSQPE